MTDPRETTMQGACDHENFGVNAVVQRIEDCSVWFVELSVKCADCGQAMVFVGFPRGLSPGQPMVDLTETEVRIPFRPWSDQDDRRFLQTGAGFTVEVNR